MMIDRAKNEKFINCLRNMNNYNSKVQNNHNIIKSTILSTMCLLRPLHSFPLSPVLVFIISSMLIIEVTKGWVNKNLTKSYLCSNNFIPLTRTNLEMDMIKSIQLAIIQAFTAL